MVPYNTMYVTNQFTMVELKKKLMNKYIYIYIYIYMERL